MLIQLIGGTAFNLESLTHIAGKGTGRSLTCSLDAIKKNLSHQAKFLSVWASFIGVEKNQIRDLGQYCEHLNFTFLVSIDSESLLDILSDTGLNISITDSIDHNKIVLITGNLKIWFNSTMLYCNKNADHVLREFFNGILGNFEKIGLAEVWINYRKKPLKDDTFYLESK